MRREAGWKRAMNALQEVFGSSTDFGFVKRQGHGVSRDAYRASFHDGREDLDVFVLVPNQFADLDFAARAEREAKVLPMLEAAGLPLRIPRLYGCVREDDGVILVESMVPGLPLDLRAGRQPGITPWEVVGQVAAAIHRVSVPPGLFEPVTCEAHGKMMIASLKGRHPLLQDARRWLKSHLPPPEPGVLVHGDLLGQNLLLGFDGQAPGVIDWERAEMGDPAHDFSIVTRGTKRPFATDDGLTKLLDAYTAAGGRPIAPERVHFFELVLLAAQFERALEDERDLIGCEERLRLFLARR